MSVTEPILWPRIVRRYTLLLITLFAVLGLATTGYIFWAKERSETTLHLINDYHLASAFHCAGAHDKITHILSGAIFDSRGIVKGNPRRFREHGDNGSLILLFHLTRQEIGDISTLQRQFADPQFSALVKRLEQSFVAIETVTENITRDAVLDLQTTDQLYSLLTILEQLKKLHTITYDDYLAEKVDSDFREGLVFIAFILLVLLVGGACFWAWRKAIDNIIEDQRISQIASFVAKEEAQEANNSKSDFLARMSHELRTPLNAIIGFSEIMQTELFGPLGDKHYREYANDIYSSGQHLLDLVNDLLDLERIEAGQYDVRFDEVNIGELVRSSCTLLKEQAKAKGIRYSNEVAQHLPLIDADSRVVRQILLNLLSNAIKFTPTGGAVIVRANVDSHDNVGIAVSDTGIGIAEEDFETLLMPFSQVANSNVSDERGAGLGLSIVNALVELHSGTLTIDSKVGEGTKVTVKLPKSQAA